jgi:hypothetical protein
MNDMILNTTEPHDHGFVVFSSVPATSATFLIIT